MGLARELTMGTRRPRTHSSTSGDYATLRALTAAAAPDLERFRAVIERVGASPERMRAGEGRVYIEACSRYRQLTGELIGPEAGTY